MREITCEKRRSGPADENGQSDQRVGLQKNVPGIENEIPDAMNAHAITMTGGRRNEETIGIRRQRPPCDCTVGQFAARGIDKINLQFGIAVPLLQKPVPQCRFALLRGSVGRIRYCFRRYTVEVFGALQGKQKSDRKGARKRCGHHQPVGKPDAGEKAHRGLLLLRR